MGLGTVGTLPLCCHNRQLRSTVCVFVSAVACSASDAGYLCLYTTSQRTLGVWLFRAFQQICRCICYNRSHFAKLCRHKVVDSCIALCKHVWLQACSYGHQFIGIEVLRLCFSGYIQALLLLSHVFAYQTSSAIYIH